MASVHYDGRVSRIMRRTIRIALRVAYVLAIFTGFGLLSVPFSHIFVSEIWPVNQKLVIIMGGVKVIVFLALSLFLLGAWLRRRLIKLRQAENDLAAQRVMSEFNTDPGAQVAAFFLYLRAFETTGRLRVPLYLRLRKISEGLYRLVTNDVESYVSKAVGRVAPLIALGRPGETIGAGRIVTEDASWMADIIALMKHAKGILLVPASRPGTLWEIETLKREGLLNKVIFIMPPRTKGEFDSKERWDAAREALASLGLEAPEHQEWGLLFKVGSDGRVSNVEPMLLNSVRQVRKSLRRILSHDSPRGGLFKAIARADKRMRRATFWGWAETLRQLSPYPIAAVALFLHHPVVGFDPSESWATVWDRFTTARSISEHKLAEDLRLGSSEKYRVFEARVSWEKRDEWRSGLQLRGLVRLEDEKLRDYFMALGDMLVRVSTHTCATIARGEVQPDAMQIAFTYIPAERVDGFLHAQTEAILAEVENAPFPAFDEKAVERAFQEFLANLGPEGQQRYARIDQAPGELSDDDQCWLVRAMYGSIATLAEPHASIWARTLAAMAIPVEDSTAAERSAEKTPLR